MESLSGSGHRFATRRLRLADKLEYLRLDPWGVFLECRYVFFQFLLHLIF